MLRSLNECKLSTIGLILNLFIDVLHVVLSGTSHFSEIMIIFTKELYELRTTTCISVKGGKKKVIISETKLKES